MGNRWSHNRSHNLQTAGAFAGAFEGVGTDWFRPDESPMNVRSRSAITDCMDPNKNPTFLQVINDPVSGVPSPTTTAIIIQPRCTTLLGRYFTLCILTLLYLQLRYDPGQATCTLRQAIGDELTAFLSERFASNKSLNTHFVNRPLVSVNFTATGSRYVGGAKRTNSLPSHLIILMYMKINIS